MSNLISNYVIKRSLVILLQYVLNIGNYWVRYGEGVSLDPICLISLGIGKRVLRPISIYNPCVN
jgi:hypothetical protein